LILFRGDLPQVPYSSFAANHSHDAQETGSSWFQVHHGEVDRGRRP
jgi:hypothetical protein